ALGVLGPRTWRLSLERDIKEWQEVARPAHHAVVRAAAARVEKATPKELVGLIDSLALDAGAYFAYVIMISGKAAKAEVPLAVLYRRYVEPVAGGSHLDLLLGLYTPAPRVPGHAVLSIALYPQTPEVLVL